MTALATCSTVFKSLAEAANSRPATAAAGEGAAAFASTAASKTGNKAGKGVKDFSVSPDKEGDRETPRPPRRRGA